MSGRATRHETIGGVTTQTVPLLLLGRGADPQSERGVECPGDLPPASDPDLVGRAQRARAALAERAFVLGHHYQRDEVIQFADVTGDSFKLARDAAARPEAEFVVFCGVHFMAESADILTADHQQVILPDLAAGCSMADMARLIQVEEAWERLEDAGVVGATVPITYMNSSADIKAFCGRNGGAVCTSSNAERALQWAFEHGEKVLFLPDQHLGRNTAVLQMGLSLDDCVVVDPHRPDFGVTDQQLRDATMLLWRGHCSVHGRFTAESVADVRNRIPDVQVIAHPECLHEVVLGADYVGSTEFIINTITAAPRRDVVGSGDRAQPGQAAGSAAPRQDSGLLGQDGLLLRDHEPDRPAASGVGDGEPGRGPCREQDRGRSRHCALGPCRPGPDAGVAWPGGRQGLAGQSPGAPHTGNHRETSDSIGTSSATNARTCNSNAESRRWVAASSGANG